VFWRVAVQAFLAVLWPKSSPTVCVLECTA
jgi:hypothetical protein